MALFTIQSYAVSAFVTTFAAALFTASSISFTTFPIFSFTDVYKSPISDTASVTTLAVACAKSVFSNITLLASYPIEAPAVAPIKPPLDPIAAPPKVPIVFIVLLVLCSRFLNSSALVVIFSDIM